MKSPGSSVGPANGGPGWREPRVTRTCPYSLVPVTRAYRKLPRPSSGIRWDIVRASYWPQFLGLGNLSFTSVSGQSLNHSNQEKWHQDPPHDLAVSRGLLPSYQYRYFRLVPYRRWQVLVILCPGFAFSYTLTSGSYRRQHHARRTLGLNQDYYFHILKIHFIMHVYFCHFLRNPSNTVKSL